MKGCTYYTILGAYCTFAVVLGLIGSLILGLEGTVNVRVLEFWGLELVVLLGAAVQGSFLLFMLGHVNPDP